MHVQIVILDLVKQGVCHKPFVTGILFLDFINNLVYGLILLIVPVKFQES